MKKVFLNQKQVVLILVTFLLTCGAQGISYGQAAPTVSPGDNDTSLDIEFQDSWVFGDFQEAYYAQWRKKTPQGPWEERCFDISISGLLPGDSHTDTVSATISGLDPGTTYQVRYNKNTGESFCVFSEISGPWSAIGEGTTSGVPREADPPETPDPPDDNGQSGGTTYGVGDVISTLPTGFYSAGTVSGASWRFSGGNVTIEFNNGGLIVVNGITYTCIAAGGCRIEDRQVTQGTIQVGDGGQTPEPAQKPDLVVGQPTVSKASLTPGESFTLSASVTNQGTGSAAATTLRYYRSTDATISSSDTEVGTDSVSSLGASSTGNESIRLNAPTTPGTYYYGVCVDSVTNESDTANNCSAAVSITVQPSETPDPPEVGQAAPTVEPGDDDTTLIVKFEDSWDFGDFHEAYYVQYRKKTPQGPWEEGCTNISISGLLPGDSHTDTVEITIFRLDPGTTYQVRYNKNTGASFCTPFSDISGPWSATGEGTTSGQIPPAQKPDLVVGQPTVSKASLTPGESFTLSASVTNQGAGSAAATTLRYYRSTDAIISTSDTEVGTDRVSALGANQTGNESIRLTAPTSAGTYYYGACVDSVTNEDNTNNNCSAAVRITVERSPTKLVKISGDNQNGLIGEVLSSPFVVEVRDQDGTPFEGVTVLFAVTGGSGTLSTTSTTTDANGLAETTLTLDSTPGANTVLATVDGISQPVTFNAMGEGIEFDLSVSAGTNLIHVPLKVTAIDGVATTLTSIADLYGALGGANTVNYLITYDSSTQQWLSYFSPSDRGTISDVALTDDTGIMAGMKSAASVRFRGEALGTDGKSTVTLNHGLNLVGLPLSDSRIARVSDMLSLEGILGNVPVILLAEGGDFNAVGRAGDPGDIAITGGQGFILTAQQASTVAISGEGWSNGSATAAAPQMLTGVEVGNTTPVLALRGEIVDEVSPVNRLGFRVAVENLSTPWATAHSANVAVNGEDGAGYRLTIVDIKMARAAQVGDVLEISAQSPNPFVGVKPLRYTVTAEDVKQNLIQLPALVAYEIPTETELLANYPNPFNPETWIPYHLANDTDVSLSIYDINGMLVRELDLGHQQAGYYTDKSRAAYWDGRNEWGERVVSGIYFYQLRADGYSQMRKMVIVK